MSIEFPVVNVPKHIREHEVLGIAIGLNPFGVTLEQAIVAGATATSTPIFDGAPSLDHSVTTAGMTLHSATTGSRTAFTLNADHPSSAPARIVRFQNDGTTVAQMEIDGDFMYGTDVDDLFIHEKQTTVVPTGNWTPTTGAWDLSGITFTPPLDSINPFTHGSHIGTKGSLIGYNASNAPTEFVATGDGALLATEAVQATGLRWIAAGATSGHVLTSNGAATLPSWQAVVGVTDGDKGDITISGSGATYTVDVDIVKTWTGLHTFDAGTQVNDNDKHLIGTGSDMEMFHDGTNNYINSNIAEGTDAQDGVRIQWDIDTAQSSIVGSGANRPGDGETAQKVASIGFTDGGSAYQEIWAFYPFAAMPIGGSGNCIVSPLHDDWFIGSRSTTSTGMTATNTALNFHYDNTLAFTANAAGLVIGGSSVSAIDGSFNLPVRIRSKYNAVPAANAAQTQFAQNGNFSAGASSPFIDFRPRVANTDEHAAFIWHSNAARSARGIGLPSNAVLTFDDTDSGTWAQGNTYMTYASGSSELQTIVDGTEVIAATSSTIGYLNTAPVAQQSVAVAATDLATVITLANDMRTALINFGLAV